MVEAPPRAFGVTEIEHHQGELGMGDGIVGGRLEMAGEETRRAIEIAVAGKLPGTIESVVGHAVADDT